MLATGLLELPALPEPAAPEPAAPEPADSTGALEDAAELSAAAEAVSAVEVAEASGEVLNVPEAALAVPCEASGAGTAVEASAPLPEVSTLLEPELKGVVAVLAEPEAPSEAGVASDAEVVLEALPEVEGLPVVEAATAPAEPSADSVALALALLVAPSVGAVVVSQGTTVVTVSETVVYLKAPVAVLVWTVGLPLIVSVLVTT